MDINAVIKSRHSLGKVKPDALPREIIEKLLSAAVQAPNHFRIRPWRFVVLTGKGRERFGDCLATAFKTKFPDAPPDALEKERQKAFRSPLVIVVAVDQPTEAKINEIENVSAVAAATQNILLAATALGLGAIWRTGETARDPEIKKFFGFVPEQHLLGFLYIGYPDNPPAEYPERPSYEDRTIWME